MSIVKLAQVVEALHQGEVIAYPTESVFGLGCDPDNPDAIACLLSLKQRPKSKGLILIAAEFSQLAPYLDISSLSDERIEAIQASWPGPVTWVLPASTRTSDWITGEFDSVAVRVSDHEQVRQLCAAFGKPIISTSANGSGLPPCRTVSEVVQQFSDGSLVILSGETGGRDNPSEIRNGSTGEVLRNG